MKKKIIYGCEARGDADKPYLIRWQLFTCRWFTIYLHKFIRSDADDLHDHPWNFWSFILWRGYFEETFKIFPDINSVYNYKVTSRKRKLIRPLSLIYRSATHTHRVVLISEKPAWTIVIRSKYIRQWGFFENEGWKLWSVYFKEKGCL